ncbi:hypothetical protein AMS68_006141 [Peltaster fructicola]|uniref:DNA repair protein Rad26 n=1 Tax=Peltaster fructicola TaxID=286661 RepID=A0A6H0Y0U2_9PEZI|nr:hypothetical protein AMS68_006141 [Peltaster fructicola]
MSSPLELQRLKLRLQKHEEQNKKRGGLWRQRLERSPSSVPMQTEKREHDRKILTMQKGFAEEAAKHRGELEAGRKEREKMQTDNRFLQHDLAQEAERAKRLNGAGKSRTIAERDTPRKIRKAGLGDGFNDDEVQMFSPIRSRGRDSTPRAGAKRKRSAQDSPIASLSFAKPAPLPRDESTDSAQTMPATLVSPSLATSQNEDTRFIQCLLVYQPFGQSAGALELLCQHHLPANIHRPLSSVLMEALSTSRQTTDSIPLQTVRVLSSLWQRCLDQQHLAPLTLLVDLILFALRHEVPSRYNKLAQDVVPLCLRALELVTMPIVRAHLKGPSALAETLREPSSEQIDADQLTALLEQMCQACSISSELISNFWRMMDFTSSMLLLHKALPYHRVMTGLRILYTSALENSFGAISQNLTDQAQQEKDTVFRLTFAFFDIPSVPADEPPYDEQEIAEFRIMVLEVLNKLCEFNHGSILLATHTHFIGRLVRFVDEQVRKLYSVPPSQHKGELVKPDDHDLVVKTINMSMRILHYLLTTHGDTIDLSEKFSVVVGGYHKFLIGMTRLAFIEQPTVFEDGIEEEVIDAAHSILDAFLTPEDGEAVAQALETPQGSKSVGAVKQRSFTMDEDTMDTDTLPADPD